MKLIKLISRSIRRIQWIRRILAPRVSGLEMSLRCVDAVVYVRACIRLKRHVFITAPYQYNIITVPAVRHYVLLFTYEYIWMGYIYINKYIHVYMYVYIAEYIITVIHGPYNLTALLFSTYE